MPQPILDERFRQGAPRRAPEEEHSWLTAEERRFILWALRERWPATRTGQAIGVSEITVRRFRRKFWDDPALLLELGLYEMTGKAREQEYRCLICNERVITRLETERHVLRHYLDEVIVDDAIPREQHENSEEGEEDGEWT